MIHIIAHNDVDGIVCHSIAEIYAKTKQIKTRHYFVDYQSIISVFNELLKVISPEDKVIIADIGYEEYLISSFLVRYKRIAERTFWYDHHKWKEEAIKRISAISKEIIINENLCASEIIQNRLLPENEIAKQLAYIARAHDFYGKGFETEVFEQACKIQDVISSGFQKERIAEQFSGGILWSEEFETAHRKFQEVIRPKEIKKMEQTVTKYSVIITNDTIANIIAVFVSDVLSSKDIRAYLMEGKERDILIAVWPNGRIAYEIRNENFRQIIEKINSNFNGGGRGLAGGATYPQKINRKNFRSCFKKIIEVISK
ncbi:MAG: hypothetical protein WCX74_02005 [Candidatus Paceibacterota bacterium]